MAGGGGREGSTGPGSEGVEFPSIAGSLPVGLNSGGCSIRETEVIPNGVKQRAIQAKAYTSGVMQERAREVWEDVVWGGF